MAILVVRRSQFQTIDVGLRLVVSKASLDKTLTVYKAKQRAAATPTGPVATCDH